MKKKCMMICIVAMLTFSGCNSRDTGEEIKEKLNDTDNVEISDSEEIGESEYDLPEKVEYLAESSTGTPYSVKVDATVEVSMMTDISIYGVKPIEFNDEYIATLADRWFDDGDYEILKPYSMCSMEELDKEKLRYQEIVKYYADINSYSHKIIGILRWGNLYADPKQNVVLIDEALSTYEDSNVIESVEGQILYESNDLDLASEKVINTKNGKLRGLVDGEEWELSASYSPASSNTNLISDFSGGYNALDGDYGLISLQPVYFEGSVVEYVNTDSVVSNMYGENICDREDALDVATDALLKLGFEGYEVIYTAAMLLDVSEAKDASDVILDGYCFVYCPNYGELDFGYINESFTGGDCGITVDGLGAGVVPPYVMVSVTTEGIYNIYFNLQYVMEEEMTKNAKLMEFSQVENIAKNYISDNLSSFYQGVTIDEIELKYVTVSYGDGNYAVVPVWLFGYSQSEIYCENKEAFGVNALDGSIVKINHFFYGTYDPYIF